MKIYKQDIHIIVKLDLRKFENGLKYLQAALAPRKYPGISKTIRPHTWVSFLPPQKQSHCKWFYWQTVDTLYLSSSAEHRPGFLFSDLCLHRTVYVKYLLHRRVFRIRVVLLEVQYGNNNTCNVQGRGMEWENIVQRYADRFIGP